MIKRIITLFLLIFVSIIVVFYQFPELPKNLSFDEVEFAKLALSLDGKPYVPYSALATGHSTLYFYLILLSFKIFGLSNFALRFPSAFFGILSILVFYTLMKFVFKKSSHTLLPFLLSIALITSHWYLNFARFSFEATFLVFLELLSLLFAIIAVGEKNQKKGFSGNWLYIPSGILAGLAYNSYTPGRIFFVVPLLLIIFSNLKHSTKDKIKSFLLYLIPFVIVVLPLTFYIMVNKDDRVDKQFYPKNTEMSVGEKFSFFLRNIGSLGLMFNVKGDINGRHNYPGKPALNLILGILFIAGLIHAIKNIKSTNNKVFLAYFIIALIPATVTYPWENPNMLRTITVIPSIAYFIGVLITGALEKFSRSKIIILIFFILLTTLSSFYELRTYFIYQSQVFDDAFEIPLQLPKALMPIK